MCVTCVATGAAYGVPALVGLKVHASRLRRRRQASVPPERIVAPSRTVARPSGGR